MGSSLVMAEFLGDVLESSAEATVVQARSLSAAGLGTEEGQPG